MPKTWCQLKSRAFAVVAYGLNSSRVLKAAHFQMRGSHKYMPLKMRNRNARLLAPVIAL
jgi:hypothetical protein